MQCEIIKAAGKYLVISKSQTPRYFKNIKNLQIPYTVAKYGWHPIYFSNRFGIGGMDSVLL